MTRDEIIDGLNFFVDIIPLFEVHRVDPSAPFQYVTAITWGAGRMTTASWAMEVYENVMDMLRDSDISYAALFRTHSFYVLTEQPLDFNALLFKLAYNLTISDSVPYDFNAAIREDLPGGVIVHDPKIIKFMGEGTA